MSEDRQPTSRRHWIGLLVFLIVVVLALAGAAYAAILTFSKTCC